MTQTEMVKESQKDDVLRSHEEVMYALNLTQPRIHRILDFYETKTHSVATD